MASGRVSMAGPSVRSGFRPAYPVFFTSPNFCVKSSQDARIMTASELPGGGAAGATLNTDTLKTLDGVASVSLRGLGQTHGAARPATGTLFLSINDVDGPKLDYSDPALVDRLVLVDFPQLEIELHGGFAKELFADAKARQAMMARLVREAAAYPKGGWQPPPLPDSVRASTDEQAAEALGALPAWFLANIELVPGASEVFCTATQIWAAAALDLGADKNAKVEGFTRAEGMMMMRRAFFPKAPHKFPAQRSRRFDGSLIKVYPGVRIKARGV